MQFEGTNFVLVGLWEQSEGIGSDVLKRFVIYLFPHPGKQSPVS